MNLEARAPEPFLLAESAEPPLAGRRTAWLPAPTALEIPSHSV